MQRYKFDHYMFQLAVCSLLHNYGTCYINYILNENLNNTMYIPYRETSKKIVFVTQNFVRS